MVDEAIQSLIERSIRGNVRAFEQLVREFQSYAFALAMRLLGDETESTDAVQESFVRVWKHLHRFDQNKEFTTWLYTIVTNCCLDRLRALKKNRKLFSSRDEESETIEMPDDRDIAEIQSNQELADIIRSLANILPLKQRLVFTLRDLQDLSVEEVSEIAGMSIGSVKTNLHYARKRIRRLMTEKYHIGRLES